MRQKFSRQISLLGIIILAILVFMGGCDHNPRKSYRRHLCSVDADGRHFQRVIYNNYAVHTEGSFLDGYTHHTHHYMNWVFRGNTPRLLIFYNDAIALADADGSNEESVYSLVNDVTRDLNVVFPEPGSNGYFNFGTKLLKIDLATGYEGTVAQSENYLRYPLCDQQGRYITTVDGQDRVLIHDLQSGTSETWTTPTPARRAYYYPSGDKLIYSNPPYVWILGRDSATADTLFNSGNNIMVRPVGDGGKFLASLPSITDLVLFDLADSTYQVLGHVNNTHPIDVCRNGRDIFFADDYTIYRHDLSSGITEPILTSGAENANARRFLSLSSSPDGQAVYFICETYDYYND